MRKIGIVALVCMALLNACSYKTTKEFIRASDEEFKPEHHYGDIVVYDRFNTILIPEIQNFVKAGATAHKIITYRKTQASLGPAEEMDRKGTVNYKWRRTDAYNGEFKKLFPKDVVIAHSYVHSDDAEYDIEPESIPFVLFRVVERDDNKDGIIEEKGDRNTLYVFDLRNYELKQISPAEIDVAHIDYRGFTYAEGRVSKAEPGSVVPKEIPEDAPRIKNYIIIFEGVANDVPDTYMYNMKSGKLEKLKYQ